jgi:Membrane bound O-acyl transferase family
MAVGSVENSVGRCASLADRTQISGATHLGPRLDRTFRIDLSSALRQLPLIALFWQTFGIDAAPIMSKPILSKTLSEFWAKRWNLGFRQLAFDLILQPLHRKTGVAVASLLVFLASGLVHDLVISLPARGGYGLPTAYFIVQGLGVTLERSALGRRVGLQHGLPAWLFMLVVAAVPAFWLFHPPFVTRVILPFMHAIHAL